MSHVLSVHHPPALRVAGRRLSVSSARPRPNNILAPITATDLRIPTSSDPPATALPTEQPDYPRPAAHEEGDEQHPDAHAHPPPHNEEEPPKKEKKHGHGSHDQNRLKESAYSKLDATMPSKGHIGAKHTFGAAGRIGQPMGRVLAV